MSSIRQHRMRQALGHLCLCLLATVARADDSSPGVFAEDSPLVIQVRAPWRTLLRDRENTPEFPAELVYDDPATGAVTLSVQVRLSGVSRLEQCSYPPMMLRLDEDRIESTIFAGHSVLHASIPCHRNRKYEEHTVQEYLAYRIYALLTETSLDTRLLRLDYWDSESGRSIDTVDAFLVENFDLAAERLGKQRITRNAVPRTALEPDAAALLAVFQFMIGHTDWSIVSGPPGKECCHNSVLLAPRGGPTDRGLVPLPFDFDASGLVNTGDTTPARQLGISSVRQRLYRGFCAYNDELQSALETTRRNRSEILGLVESATSLGDGARRRSHKFLEQFYTLIDDPAQVETKMLGNCRDR